MSETKEVELNETQIKKGIELYLQSHNLRLVSNLHLMVGEDRFDIQVKVSPLNDSATEKDCEKSLRAWKILCKQSIELGKEAENKAEALRGENERLREIVHFAISLVFSLDSHIKHPRHRMLSINDEENIKRFNELAKQALEQKDTKL